MPIRYRDDVTPSRSEIVDLYRSLAWSSADKPEALHAAMAGSHGLVTAWDGERLVGLGNAISDGHLVVYYPHLLVRPEYQGQGIGAEIMGMMKRRYGGFHQQALIADARAVGFYEKLGFACAGTLQPMWIFHGHEHD